MARFRLGQTLRCHRSVLLKLVPVIGSIILFSSWVLQQTMIEEVTSLSARIASAESIYQTYQSNNALFNAILVSTHPDKQFVDQIRGYQISNYELGLRGLESVLTPEERRGIPMASNPSSVSANLDAAMRATQTRLEELQERVAAKKAGITARKESLTRLFFCFYAAGSIIVLVGTVLAAVSASNESKQAQESPDAAPVGSGDAPPGPSPMPVSGGREGTPRFQCRLPKVGGRD